MLLKTFQKVQDMRRELEITMYSVWQKPDEHNRVCEMKNIIKKNSVDVNFNIDEQIFTQVSLSLVSDN